MNWNNLPPLSPEDQFKTELNAKLDKLINDPLNMDAAQALMGITIWKYADPKSPGASNFLISNIKMLQYSAIRFVLNELAKAVLSGTAPNEINAKIARWGLEAAKQSDAAYDAAKAALNNLKLSGAIAPQSSGSVDPNPSAGQTP